MLPTSPCKSSEVACSNSNSKLVAIAVKLRQLSFYNEDPQLQLRYFDHLILDSQHACLRGYLSFPSQGSPLKAVKPVTKLPQLADDKSKSVSATVTSQAGTSVSKHNLAASEHSRFVEKF